MHQLVLWSLRWSELRLDFNISLNKCGNICHLFNRKGELISVYFFHHFCKKKQEYIFFSQVNAPNFIQLLFQLCLLVRIPLYLNFKIVDNSWTKCLNCTLWFQNKQLKISQNINSHPKETYLHTMCPTIAQQCSPDGQFCFSAGFYWLSQHSLPGNTWCYSWHFWLWSICGSYIQPIWLHHSQQMHLLILHSSLCWLLKEV